MTDDQAMRRMLSRVWEAVEALELLIDARNEAMRDYTGEGVPERLRPLQGSLRDGTQRLVDAMNELTPSRGYDQRNNSRKREVQVTGDDLLPDAIRHAYTTLYSLCYGSSGTIMGDPNAEAIVPREWFTKSDQQQTRGVAKQGSRKYSSSVRSVIKNERALELKKRVDKRLRKLAKDIYTEWETGGVDEENYKCWSCHKIAQREWKWCPRCGDRLVKK